MPFQPKAHQSFSLTSVDDALTVERNGLLQRQRALEENLQKALKATPRDAVESLVNDRIAAFMQERPKEHE